ncbi:Arsenical resistance operon trans-acting repressor ArsD [Caulifigura coniformis]|uniref:Arsenite methyltransferase n=1 Tax=Caulifigura coniformis TaxID=2527983 RepID=A0A517SCQ6_9PLAN|nr:arsenite efflux transporter metallochaperone ArsD [Caulifigura coniformis]QDT53908.1 Arsenical resistance operon trans-acting repressor ArsD [Caulifigura coniformis]
MDTEEQLKVVSEQYGAVARSGLNNEHAGVRAVAAAFGYSEQDLASLPPQANMGLSCGNPVALAGLREGETVVDLGSGGGLDVLLASKRVGPTGKAIGIDMTPDMVDRARAGAAEVGATNVEFHLARIDQLPLPDASVDCVISNCVINLAPDKAAVFREILRVLKPGGRMVVSDIALRKPLPESVADSVQALVGCIAGAILIEDYERLLREAGFEAVVVQDTGANLNAYAQASGNGCCGGSACGDSAPTGLHDELKSVLQTLDVNAYAASVRVHALKTVDESFTFEQQKENNAMKTIQVFDKPMCCSTGVCGPRVDPVLPKFAADLDWLKSQGHTVERYNLAQQPQEFLKYPEVHKLIGVRGVECLPIVMVDGKIVSRRGYPSREMLEMWTTNSSSGQTEDPAKSSGGSC